MDCFRPFRIPSACSVALAALLALPAAARAQQVDEGLVAQLAGLLALADARQFDRAILEEGLRHADPAVRRQAAFAAGRIGDAAAVDLLLPALDDSMPVVQAAAAFALGLLREPRALPRLLTLVRAVPAADQGDAQREAVTAIARIGGEQGAAALRSVLQTSVPGTETPPAVDQALLESWRLGDRAPIAQIQRFVDDADLGTRWRTLYALARLRKRAAVPPLLAALQDREPQVRAVAVRGLARVLTDSAGLQPSAVISRIRPLLGDRDAGVRINALRALATFRDSSVTGAVAPLLADPDPGVVVQAETTLGVLGGRAAVEALMPRAQSALFGVRRQAVIALAEADSAVGNPVAAELAADPDWRWRSVVAEAFGAAGARARLEALLGDNDGRVVAQALQSLQRVVPGADTVILPRARALLVHDDPAVRSVAADLLARQPDPGDVERLVQAYRRAAGDPFNDARLSAVAALAAIAGASAAGRLEVATRFVAVVPPSDDYLVRRLAAERLPDAAQAWGPATPIATGRTSADYRDVARRYLVPGLQGQLPRVMLDTERGTLEVQLYAVEAPLTVAAFLSLVERGYFDGSRWHRVVPNFVVQDGDPRGDGWGGPGFVLRDEVNPVRYEVGTMGMALSGPDTGGSQFFITHGPQPHLDGIYTVFGRVVTGSGTLGAIVQGDRLRSVRR